MNGSKIWRYFFYLQPCNMTGHSVVPSEIEEGKFYFFNMQNTTYMHIYCILFISFSPLNCVCTCHVFQVQLAIIW